VIAAPPPPPPPARVQVVATEFRFVLSRTNVAAGRVVIELVNQGQDAHDLRLRRVGGTHVFRWATVRPGRHVDRGVRLRAGRYSLWCGLPGHRDAGMHAFLVVTAPRRTR